MSIDRIANMLSALKNASMVSKRVVELPYSKECEAIAKILKTKGFLEEVKVFKPKGVSYKKLSLTLIDPSQGLGIEDVKRVSKPGRRVYASYKELHPVAGGLGVQVVSTSRGIMDSIEAKKKKLGGEILCEVR